MLANNELKSLIIALGTNFGEQFNIEDLRYGRIIIMTDADVDGAHIRTLLLTFFYRYFPDIITQGHLFIAKPPLYMVKKGKEVNYVYTDEELEALKKKLGVVDVVSVFSEESEAADEEGEAVKEKEKSAKLNIQRYKGLGEMNPQQLWDTTMDPAQRIMKKVSIEDAVKANEIFEILMGSDVSSRKRFIQIHATSVRNLDV